MTEQDITTVGKGPVPRNQREIEDPCHEGRESRSIPDQKTNRRQPVKKKVKLTPQSCSVCPKKRKESEVCRLESHSPRHHPGIRIENSYLRPHRQQLDDDQAGKNDSQ